MADLTFLDKPERRTAAMLMVVGALLWLGWKAHDVIGDAQAAEARVGRLERRTARIDRGLTRLMLKQGLTPEPDEDELAVIQIAGPRR